MSYTLDIVSKSVLDNLYSVHKGLRISLSVVFEVTYVFEGAVARGEPTSPHKQDHRVLDTARGGRGHAFAFSYLFRLHTYG